jgi:hypothetical protein
MKALESHINVEVIKCPLLETFNWKDPRLVLLLRTNLFFVTVEGPRHPDSTEKNSPDV